MLILLKLAAFNQTVSNVHVHTFTEQIETNGSVNASTIRPQHFFIAIIIYPFEHLWMSMFALLAALHCLSLGFYFHLCLSLNRPGPLVCSIIIVIIIDWLFQWSIHILSHFLFLFQKFRFLGDCDSPDWVLAEIHSSLSMLTSVKLKILAQLVAGSILGEEVPVSI